jgi:hypothetical protein
MLLERAEEPRVLLGSYHRQPDIIVGAEGQPEAPTAVSDMMFTARVVVIGAVVIYALKYMSDRASAKATPAP